MAHHAARLPGDEVAALARVALTPRWNVFHAPQIPAPRVRAALAAILGSVGPLERILALIDASPDGSGRSGVVLLDQRFALRAEGAPVSLRYHALAEQDIEVRGATLAVRGHVVPLGDDGALAAQLGAFLRRVATAARGEGPLAPDPPPPPSVERRPPSHEPPPAPRHEPPLDTAVVRRLAERALGSHPGIALVDPRSPPAGATGAALLDELRPGERAIAVGAASPLALTDGRLLFRDPSGERVEVEYRRLPEAGPTPLGPTVHLAGRRIELGDPALARGLVGFLLAVDRARREPAPSAAALEATGPSSAPAIDPRDLALARFLWGAGSRRLHLAPTGRPTAGAPAVESLDELLTLFTDGAGAPEAALRALLGSGQLERWLRDALGATRFAEATRALRLEGKPRRLARWLDLAARTR